MSAAIFQGSDLTRYRPASKAFCHRCDRNTRTQVHLMSGGWGNCCAYCGCCRRGKPYLSKAEVEALKRHLAAEGVSNDQPYST